MAHLFHPDESVAAASLPELAAELARIAPDGLHARQAQRWADDLRIIDPAPTTRARLLGELLYPGETPSPHAIHTELLNRWLASGDVAEVLRKEVEADPTCPVLIDSQLWSTGSVVADWGFFLDHFIIRDLLGYYTVVVPIDARWVLYTGMEEWVKVAQPSFARIRALTYAPTTEVNPGMAVPKAQCRVTFDDGDHWDSGRILAPDPRAVALAFLGFLSARSGVQTTQVDVLTDLPQDRPGHQPT